jgi:DNA-binding response OmpR family regulator
VSHPNAKDILIIEDDASMLEFLAMGFRRAGFSVRTAQDGAEGLIQFRRQPAAAVISDLNLPDADGLLAISEIKACRSGTPVLAISGGGFFATSDLLALARAIGADAALAKPFRVADAVSVICDLLSPQLAELAA